MYKGWYSKQQENLTGYAIYKDDKGKEVKITQISASEQENSPNNWDDTVCVGLVVKFVRQHWKEENYEK